MGIWSEIKDGTSIGPTIYVEGKHCVLSYTALWSDEEGILVSVECVGEQLMTQDMLAETRSAVDQLLDLQPPLVTQGADS